MKSKRQELFSEYPGIYDSTKEAPNVIRMRMRMADEIEEKALLNAVRLTAERYPYFCVELKHAENGEMSFLPNTRPISVVHSQIGVELNSPDSNWHMMAFSWDEEWITVDISHAMTDGDGLYHVIRTLLYYYCSEHYRVSLSREGLRLLGDRISEEEWTDPLRTVKKTVSPFRSDMKPSLKLLTGNPIKADNRKTVYSIVIPESELMNLIGKIDSSPATLVALFLSRIAAELFPDSTEPIRIGMYVNWRKALNAPLAHQCLVGSVPLNYHMKIRSWPLERQTMVYRAMTFAQLWDDNVLYCASAEKELIEKILSRASEKERRDIYTQSSSSNVGRYTATVSYVGKACFGEAERYVRDFRTWVCATSSPCVAEMNAVNGRFTIDLCQSFSDRLLADALIGAFKEHGVSCELQDERELVIPNIRLP